MSGPTRLRAPLLGTCLLAACSAGGERPPDVLLVTLDTLRADFLAAYGYERPASPRLDALAAEGVLFEHHFTTIATTAPAHATLFTGRFAREHALMKNGQALPEELPAVPELLSRAGYRTAASIGARILGSEHGFARGFDEFDEDFGEGVLRPVGKSGRFERFGESVVDRAIGMLERADGRPLFLWVHLYDVHEPYAPPRRSPLKPERSLEFFRRRAHPSELLERELVARMLAGYEAEVYYVDREVGRLLDAWDGRDRADESVVIVTSDHGEGLGEHAYQGHGFLLYEEQVRVPLIVRLPHGAQAGARVAAANSSVDLAATILHLAGLAPGGVPGSPLLDADELPSEPRDAFAERRVFEGADLRRSEALRALVSAHADEPLGSIGEKCMLVRDGWKVVWNESGRHELYDLGKDPDEAINLFDLEAERAAELLAALEAWRERGPILDRDDDAPVDAETREMLDALGY